MEPALQRRVQRYGWDKASAQYELFWQEQLRPAQESLLSSASILPGEQIIETACGTGLVSFEAARQTGSSGYLLGTDISEKMVEIASATAREKGITQAHFERMDAEDLSAIDHRFDIAICSLGLMYVPDPIKAMHEMYRVLKPGGRIAVTVWGKRDHCGWSDIFEIVDRRVTSEVCPMFFNLGNNDMLRLSLEKAGFSEVKEIRFDSVLKYENDEDACGAAFAGGPVALAYFKFTEQIKEEVHKEYIQSISRFKKGAGYEVPGEFVVATGQKKE